eukprot:765816-Hanusia_phi.AAC.2
MMRAKNQLKSGEKLSVCSMEEDNGEEVEEENVQRPAGSRCLESEEPSFLHLCAGLVPARTLCVVRSVVCGVSVHR